MTALLLSLNPAGTRAPFWVLLREAIFYEVHWAFYRNAPLVFLGTYWGAWAGLGLVAVEAALNPCTWRDLGDGVRLPGLLVRAGLAVLSTVLAQQTGNLWLAVLVHWAITWALARWVRVLAARRPAPSPVDPLSR